MTESILATRANVQIGSVEVNGFMLPDDSYRIFLYHTAECIGKPDISTFDFWCPKTIKRLLGEAGGSFVFLPRETRWGCTNAPT